MAKKNMRSKRVLIIDDDKRMSNSLKRWLRLNQYQCIATTSPFDGLEKAKACPPDLILLDLNMPGMNGYGVLMELKKHEELSHIPVVILSGLKHDNVVRGAMDLGANAYLAKTHILQDLVPILDDYLVD